MSYREDREINIIDLVKCILKKWPILLIFALLGLALGCGYKAYSNHKAILAPENTQEIVGEQEIAQLEDALTDSEKRKVEITKGYNDNLIELDEYMENSIYYNLDCRRVENVSIIYMIDNGYTYNNNEDIHGSNLSAIVEAYKNYITSGGIDEDIYADDDSIPAEYLSELIRFNNNSGTPGAQDAVATINIKIYGRSGEEASELAKKLEEKLEAYQKNVSADVGDHEIKLIAENAGEISDDELKTYQSGVVAEWVNYQTQIETNTAAFSENQTALYKALTTDGETPVANETDESEISSVFDGMTKYAVIGLVGCVFAVCVIIAIIYIFSGSIKTEEEFSSVFRLFVLGNIRDEELVLANAGALLKKADAGDVYITTTLPDIGEGDFSSLMEGLGKDGIKSSFGVNALKNAEVLNTLSGYKNVIIAETVKRSRYEDVAKLLEILREQNINVIGVVIK